MQASEVIHMSCSFLSGLEGMRAGNLAALSVQYRLKRHEKANKWREKIRIRVITPGRTEIIIDERKDITKL